MVCPEGIQPCNMKNGDIYWRIYKIQETLYIGQWHISPLQSSQSPWDLTLFSQFPSAAPSYFLDSHRWSEIFSLSKVILVLGKARSHRVPNPGFRGAEPPGWFDVLPINSAQGVMHEWACCHDEAVNHQLPIAAAFWVIWIVSAEECSSLTQNLVQICCSVILNAVATQYTCSLNDIYCLCWPVQWSCHCSHLHILFHSCWLQVTSMLCKLLLHSHYINNDWTVSGLTKTYVCVCKTIHFMYGSTQ